jgi:LPS sulfotransferase NodH
MHNNHFLYSTDYDFPVYESDLPRKHVCIHFVPRSGTNLLADLIRQSSSLGFPLEYFSKNNIELISKRLPNLTYSDFSDLVRIRTSPNGYFSYKWNSDFDQLEHSSFVKIQFRPDYHIFIDRLDVHAQAVSYLKACHYTQLSPEF